MGGAVQTPATQVAPAEHPTPHAPQLERSVCVFTQLAPHRVVCAGHTHTPPTHPVPRGHRTPQLPQLLESVDVSMQLPLHICLGGKHTEELTHRPAEQICPAAHLTPQLPQFPSSDCVSRQNSPQSESPPGHGVAPKSSTAVTRSNGVGTSEGAPRSTQTTTPKVRRGSCPASQPRRTSVHAGTSNTTKAMDIRIARIVLRTRLPRHQDQRRTEARRLSVALPTAPSPTG